MTSPAFLPRESYLPAERGYRFLPFRFLRWPGDKVLVVNDVGEFLFLSADRFEAFVRHRLDRGDPSYADLKAKHFLFDTPSNVPLDLLATKYRTKSHLDGFTKLHLFVVTLRCDHSCHYCQVSRVSTNRTKYDMSEETASRAIDLMFRCPSPAVKVEFQGGESLLNFDLIRFIVEMVEARGADPLFNYRTQGDIVGHRPTSAFCTKNMEIIRHLFHLLREGDPFTRNLLTAWGTGVRLDTLVEFPLS